MNPQKLMRVQLISEIKVSMIVFNASRSVFSTSILYVSDNLNSIPIAFAWNPSGLFMSKVIEVFKKIGIEYEKESLWFSCILWIELNTPKVRV